MSEKRQDVHLPGGITVIGVTDEHAKVLKGREAFVKKYCADRGWNMLNLTIDQLLEIRSQPDWKNPA